MPHDKIRAAARKRMAETGEPYAAARRAAVAEHQRESLSPGTGYALRMSGEIHDWLVGLRDSDPAAAMVVGQALAALLNEGAPLGEPLVASTADSWPSALAEGLDRSYRERMARLAAVRQALVDATALVEDIRGQAADLESGREDLRRLHRRLLDAGRADEAAQAAGALAVVEQQAATVTHLAPKVVESRRRLDEEMRRLQVRTVSFGARKEVLKASYTSAHLSLLLYEGTTGTSSTAEARLLRDVTAQMERELGQEPWPQGLMELRPTGPAYVGIRILFAVEAPGTVVLIAVLDGPEAVRNRYLEAILVSADMLWQVRAGQAPQATAHGYDNTRSFLREFYPGDAGDARAEPPAPGEA
jgi:phage shock protein A